MSGHAGLVTVDPRPGRPPASGHACEAVSGQPPGGAVSGQPPGAGPHVPPPVAAGELRAGERLAPWPALPAAAGKGAAADLPPAPDAAALVARVRAEVAETLAPLAERIDREGFYPAAAMAGLGAQGAFSAHLAAHTRLPRPSLAAAIDAMAEISAACMSTGFCAWCQDACAWYLEHSDNAALREELQPRLAAGALMGGTGLSNPVKALSGIERFKLRGTRVPGGYEVSGVLPWVSNLGEGHVFGTIFEDAEDPAHRVMAMVRCGQPGVRIKATARFVALEGTGTYAVLFRRAFLADAQLLADPLDDMVARIRPGFILLQAGMGLGVIRACIEGMRVDDRTHAGTNRFLTDGADAIETRLAAAHAAVTAAAGLANDRSPAMMRAVLSARLQVSELALQAAQAAMLHAGSRGYIEGSAVHRRLREAWFVAIITPSVRHLRMELERLGD